MKSTQARCSEKNGYSNDRFHSRIVVARLGGGGVTGDQKSKKHWQFLARNRQKFQFEVGGRERRKTNSIFCRQEGGEELRSDWLHLEKAKSKYCKFQTQDTGA